MAEQPRGLPPTNSTIVSTDDLIARGGPPNWSHRVALTERVQGMFIYHKPGLGNKRHYHEGESEFWIVLKGRLRWTFDDEVVEAGPGDIVFAAAGRRHMIEVIGDEPSVRFAVAAPDIHHIYEERT